MEITTMQQEQPEQFQELDTPRSNNSSTSPRIFTREITPLQNEGDDVIDAKNDGRCYKSIEQLRMDRLKMLKEISCIDSQVEGMLRMKGIYQTFCVAMQNFSSAILNLERNNQGVPYVSNVKSLVRKMYEEFRSDDVMRQLEAMCQQQVPFLEDLMTQFSNFRHLCESIIVTHVHYHVTFLEDFHMVAGKLRGMMKTIITLLYGEQASGKEDEESSDGSIDKNGNYHSIKTIEMRLINDGYQQQQQPDIIEASKELHQLRDVLNNINEQISGINRLSLGNPRVQSMKSTFQAIVEVLHDTVPLLNQYHYKIPCIENVEAVILRMQKVASVKKPTEKHIEQLKMMLGECDGKLLIIAKFTSIQNDQSLGKIQNSK